MPRNHPSRQPQGPTLSPEQARIQLERSLKRANELLQEQPLTGQRFEVWRMNAWEERRKRLKRKTGFLEALIEDLTTVDAQTESTGSDFFGDLDIDICRVSQQLFKDGHFADSISAAFKELNNQVKQRYEERRGVELDGADLMRKAFSPNNPLFILADQSSETGANIQQGFMDLFAGSMIGIRNPHAHENLSLDSDGAKHFLYLASLLMKKFKTVR